MFNKAVGLINGLIAKQNPGNLIVGQILYVVRQFLFLAGSLRWLRHT